MSIYLSISISRVNPAGEHFGLTQRMHAHYHHTLSVLLCSGLYTYTYIYV